ncbi:MAG: Ig-like domain-containing protein [Gemmatimonadota bacterium]
MERRLDSVPSGFGRPIGTALALIFGIAACGGEEDCSVTDSCPNQAPSVTITAPADGATVDEFQSITFQGSASDAEDGSLTGSSLVWTSSIDGSIGTGTSFTRNDLTPGTHDITLTATDGDGRTGSESVALTVTDLPNEAPTAEITDPADGASASAGDPVTFDGTATDTEEGTLTGAALVWTSDLDGTLGTGTSVTTSSLSGGTHEIVLTATDSQGAFGADTIAFSITGAPGVEITAPSDQASGAPHTVFEGTGVTFTGEATDAEDGDLTGGSLVWSSNVDGEIGTGETFSTSSLSPGMHTVTLTATDSDMNESRATVLAIVKPPATGGYQIHIRWSEGVELTAAQQTAVEDAVTKLESIITGDVEDIPTTEFPDASTCGGAAIPKMEESVDDVIIYLEFVPIDGPFGTVASAGPCFTRTTPGGSSTAFSIVGGLRFDEADLQLAETEGIMDDVILHEMMHVLGFGIFWEDPVDYLEQPSNSNHPEYDAMNTDTHFTGPEATARFLSIGGDDYTGGEIVPVENDTDEYGIGSLDGHWRESVFDDEAMSTELNVPANPTSVVTIGQFEDLGYTVDYDAADPYTQTFSVVLEPHDDRPVVDLSDDVWRGELHGIDPDGTARRIR